MENKTSLEPLDQAQREIIERELGKTLLVEAAAGTGKTTSMIRRMVRLISSGTCRTETLAAVTFTRKAAAELRSRFQIELEKASRAATPAERTRLSDALQGVEGCFVGTIHSFCARMLRERPVEAGVDVAFDEIDDAEDRALRQEAWYRYINVLYATDDPILDELREIDVEIADLGEAFMQLAEYPDVPEWPARRMPLPDLGNAKSALADIVRHMERVAVQLPEDPGSCKLIPRYRLIPMMYRQARPRDRVPEIMDVLAEFKEVKLTLKMWPNNGPQPKDELGRYDEFRVGIAEPLVRSWREYRYEPLLRAIRPAEEVYTKLRLEKGKLNYQDLLMLAAALLRDKPRIREYFRKRFTHLLVDEFQDTDPVQAEVMMLLTADDPEESDWRRCRPAAGALFVVGDPKQSIYRFRRADIVTYNQVKRIIEKSGGQVVNLSSNFRTIRPLIDWVNITFSNQFQAHPPECSPEYVPLRHVRDYGAAPDIAGLQVLRIPKELSKAQEIGEYDADLIARSIAYAVERRLKVPRTQKEEDAGADAAAQYGDFLIITPQTGKLGLYSHKLQEMGIPHQVTGGTAMNKVKELSMLHTCLIAVTQPENPVALVAVLRSELFGFKDVDLYDFRRLGGRFSFHSRVPEALAPDISESFIEAFDRLQKYALWLARLPAVSAIEKIAGDLGLLARSLASAGGDVKAGSFAKALELLRTAQNSVSTVGELVDCLGRIVQEDEKHDAIPARPHESPVVRVMNLHKVKGLEAPIVFLADPTGKKDHQVELYVDRSGPTVQGYLPIYGTTAGRRFLLAQPENWGAFAEKEKQFQKAEELRLLYVAATRAGAQLTVSQRESGNGRNPWSFFEPHLTEVPECPSPGPQQPVSETEPPLTDEEISEAFSEIEFGWTRASKKTYEVLAVKAMTIKPGKFTYPQVEHGAEWGSVVHLLLEAAMTNPGADIGGLAAAALAEHDLDTNLSNEAVETVRSVTRSEIWQRAASAERRLVEVPFQRLISGDSDIEPVNTVLRGVIDLAFREPEGWVIIDYKSDRVPAGRIPELVELYSPQVLSYADAWMEITGQAVHEVGLYFIHTSKYVRVLPG